jgi:hypothetical protein
MVYVVAAYTDKYCDERISRIKRTITPAAQSPPTVTAGQNYSAPSQYGALPGQGIQGAIVPGQGAGGGQLPGQAMEPNTQVNVYYRNGQSSAQPPAPVEPYHPPQNIADLAGNLDDKQTSPNDSPNSQVQQNPEAADQGNGFDHESIAFGRQ